MKLTLSPFLRKVVLQIKKTISFLIPNDKNELLLFITFYLFYLSYSLVIIFKTALIDDTFPCDLYFNFDNTSYYHKGYTYIEAHPLIEYFVGPLLFIGDTLKSLFHYKVKTLFFGLFFVLLSSLSCTYIFRYIYKIIELSKIQSVVLTIFYGIISTNLILCFTPESFSLSSFVLVVMVLYYSTLKKQGKKAPFFNELSFVIILGGITFTNFVKGVISIIFINEKNRQLIKKSFIAILSFGIVLFFTPHFLERTIELYESFATFVPEHISYGLWWYGKVSNFFYGATIMFPNITTNEVFFFDVYRNNIYLDYYQHLWQYFVVGILYVLVIASVIKGIKNEFVLYLSLLFSADIAIHIILRYGIIDYFIYGGHWVYCIPLLLGWLLKNVSKKTNRILFTIMSSLLVVIFINNMYILRKFLYLAIEYYPAY